MNIERALVVDFVAKGDRSDEWKLVLVEEGPWIKPTDEQLKRIQDRLYNTIDAVLDGQLAEKFPDTRGKNVVIQLDGYNLPEAEVSEFFDKFSRGVLITPDYQRALENNRFIKKISFQANFQSIN